MRYLELEDLVSVLNKTIESGDSILPVREFVFSLYEAEEDLEASPELQAVLAVLAPYLEFEEANGDERWLSRLARLADLLPGERPAERTVLALEYDELRALADKLRAGLLSQEVFVEQVRKVSPADFDAATVAMWAKTHVAESSPVVRLLT